MVGFVYSQGMESINVMVFLRVCCLLAFISVLGSAGCVKPITVPIGDLLDEVQVDEVAALDKYEGRSLQVSGRVSNKGLKTRREILATFGRYSASLTSSSRQVPFAVMEASAGSVICFFGTKKQIVGLATGSHATFEGRLTRVKSRGEIALVYMTDCTLAEGAGGEEGESGEAWDM